MAAQGLNISADSHRVAVTLQTLVSDTLEFLDGGDFHYDSTSSNFTQDDDDYYDIPYRAQLIAKKPFKILALTFSIITIIVNIIGLIGIYHVKGGLTPRLRLILSLSFSDIFVSLSFLLHIITRVVNPLYRQPHHEDSLRVRSICIFMFIKGLMITANIMSLFNLFGMAVDLYIAIMRPLRYAAHLNKTRVNIMIVSFWIVAFIFGFSDFYSGSDFSETAKNHSNPNYNYCEHIMYNNYYTEYLMFCTAFLCLIVMVLIYGCIYYEVKRHHDRAPPLQQEFSRNKKALCTTLIILGSFFVCWIPYCLFEISMIIQLQIDPESVSNTYETLLKFNEYLQGLLILNTLCDPIIYIIRITEVRQGLRMFFSQCCRRCCFNRNDRFNNNIPRAITATTMNPLLIGDWSSGINSTVATPTSDNVTVTTALTKHGNGYTEALSCV